MGNEVVKDRRKEDSHTLEVALRLESHEAICEERYKNIEDKMDEVKDNISEVKETLSKVTWAILAGMSGILVKLFLGG